MWGMAVAAAGLSPHARGNRVPGRARGSGLGSIPARAGQPCLPVPRTPGPGVYPRTRGATVDTDTPPTGQAGLSPHARGNHSQRGERVRLSRSIPARAGQPYHQPRQVDFLGVYPRTRGATLRLGPDPGTRPGLSPHARGNLGRYVVGGPQEGSIPARAGQPRVARRRGNCVRVYPRTRGATITVNDLNEEPAGLSPHARGNLTMAVPKTG